MQHWSSSLQWHHPHLLIVVLHLLVLMAAPIHRAIRIKHYITHHVNNNCKYETPSSLQWLIIVTATVTPPPINHDNIPTVDDGAAIPTVRERLLNTTTSTYSVPSSDETTIVETTSRNNNRPKPVAPPSSACRCMILSLYCWLLFYAAVSRERGSWSSFVADDNMIRLQSNVGACNIITHQLYILQYNNQPKCG